MRVLHVHDYPLEYGGGAEVLIARTLALWPGASDFFSIQDVVDGKLTPARYIHHRPACRALALRIRAFRPDVVHLHNYYHVLSPSILAAIPSRIRTVMTVHDYHMVCPNSGGNYITEGRMQPVDPAHLGSWKYLLSHRWDHRSRRHSLLKLAQFLIAYRLRHLRNRIDLAICPTQFVADIIGQAGIRTQVLPHPAPIVPTDLPAKAPGFRTVIAGRLEPEKGVAELLEIWPSDAELHIIGDGIERATCERLAVGKSVTFHGRLPHAETIRRIAQAHVLAMPSRCLETYGLGVVEALAVGTRPLVSDRGAMRELVMEATIGERFSDAAELGVAIERLRQAGPFDATTFLTRRTEQAYLAGLCTAYRSHQEPRTK